MSPADQAVHVALAIAGIVLGALVAAGLGCAVAVVAAAFPRVVDRVDRQARVGGTAIALVVGTLATLGALAVIAGAGKAAPGAGAIAAIVLGIPLFLAWVAGLLAVVPLVGERILGLAGPSASPLRRAVTGSVAFALAGLPGLAFHPLFVLVALLLVAWPVGVAAFAALSRRPAVAAAPPPPAAS
jgi:hypothetical protein